MLTLNAVYSLKRRGLLSNDSNIFLYTLYLPLIGYKSLFIYELLKNEYMIGNKERKLSYLLEKSSLSFSDFINNKTSLESVGLLQTLVNGDNYVFILKSVLYPNDFFMNEVLKGLYVNKVGNEEALKMMKYFEIDNVDFSKYTDISAGVKETFKIDFSANDVNLNNECKMVTINKNVLKDDFDDIKLIEYIAKNSHINPKEITNDDIKEMHRLGVLYNLNEQIMGYILIDGYNSSREANHKVDFAYCNNRCKTEVRKYKVFNKQNKIVKIDSTSDIAQRINYYETNSPRLFLKDKQDGVEPISSDLDIISYLSENMAMSNGVINVILEYTLERLDNKLNRKYVEKVAASIKRKKITSALETYDYLFTSKSETKSSANFKEKLAKVENSAVKDDNKNDDEINDDLLKELDKLL